MEKVKESAARGQVRQITDDSIKAYDNGSLKGKETLVNFVSDIARNLVAKGKGGRRLHGSTKRVFEVVKQWGGPRTHQFIIANFEGPAIETVRREAAKGEVSNLGLTEGHFKHLAIIYAGKMKEHSIEHPVMVEAAEDETRIRKEGQWRQRDASLYDS